jgi:hypothetical protein
VWAEGVWKLAWFFDDEDVSVDFVRARGFLVVLAPFAPEKAGSRAFAGFAIVQFEPSTPHQTGMAARSPRTPIKLIIRLML